MPIIYKFFREENVKSIFKSISLFIIPLSIYLYFPIASMFLPPINWGNPKKLKGFLWLISGGDYSMRYLLKPFYGNVCQNNYIFFLYHNILFQIYKYGKNFVFFLSIFLIFLLSKKEVKLLKKLSFLIIYFASITIFYFHYTIPDISDNFGVVYATFAIIFVFGLRKIYKFACIILFFALSFNYLLNFKYFQEKPYFYRFEKTIMKLPKNSIVITHGDEIYAMWYIKYCLNERKDISYVGGNFINYKWYASFFEKEKQLKIKTYDNWLISPYEWSRRLIEGVIKPNIKNRPLFYLLVPDKILFNFLEFKYMKLGYGVWKIKKIRYLPQ